MATETFSDDVEILGSEDETQLVVRGHSTQTNPLQEWQDKGASGLAQVTADGRLRTRGNLELAGPSALVEANREIELPSSEPKQGIQSRGVIDGGGNEISESLAWSVQELELKGTGGVDGLHVAQRAELTQANTGDADSAALRAGDFAAINQGGSSQTPVGQATGLHGAVENESGAYLGKAVSVEAQISNGASGDIEDAAAFEVAVPSNDGTIDNLYGLKVPDLTEGQTNNYAIHTGQGLVHLGDQLVVAGSADKAQLRIDAYSTQTNSIVDIRNSAGSTMFEIGDDTFGIFGATPVGQPAGYTTFSNLSTDRSLDADSTTLDEVADVLGTLIEDLKALGLIAA